MATEAQTEANRENSQRSTGPKSADGKARSSRNAILHGLRSRRTLVPGEDGQGFLEFALTWTDELEPVGAVETFYAEEAISLAWRMRRFTRIEGGLFELLEELRLKGARSTTRRQDWRKWVNRRDQPDPTSIPRPDEQPAP